MSNSEDAGPAEPGRGRALPESATCQVCGDRLAGELAWCPVCETPHHQDCWSYLGRCSTYGCTPASAALASRPDMAVPYTGLASGRHLPEALLVEEGPVMRFTSEGSLAELQGGEVALQIPSRMLTEVPATLRERQRVAFAGIITVLLLALAAQNLQIFPWPVLLLLGAALVFINWRAEGRGRPPARLVWLVRGADGGLLLQTGRALSPAGDRVVEQERETFEANALVALIHGRGITEGTCRIRLCLCLDRARRDDEEPRPLLDLLEPWSGPRGAPSAEDRLKAARSLGTRLARFLGVPLVEREGDRSLQFGAWPASD